MLDPEFLAILACPQCGAALRDLDSELECTSASCGLVYAVEDGIPNLLVEEARKSRGHPPQSAAPGPSGPNSSSP